MNLAGLLLARGIGRRGELAAARRARREPRTSGSTAGRREPGALGVRRPAPGLALAYWATQALTARQRRRPDGWHVRADPSGRRLSALHPRGVDGDGAWCSGWCRRDRPSHVAPEAALRERARGATADRRHHRVAETAGRDRGGAGGACSSSAPACCFGRSSNLARVRSRIPAGRRPSRWACSSVCARLRRGSPFVDQILDRVEAVPGVKAAGTIQFLPLRAIGCGTGFWRRNTRPPRIRRDRSRPNAGSSAAATSRRWAFRSSTDGRSIGAIARRPPRAWWSNQSFARRYFPDGPRPRAAASSSSRSNQALAEIVGVVGDVRHNGLTSDPVPTVFLLHAQTPGYITNLVVRTSGDPLGACRGHPPRHSRGRSDAGRLGGRHARAGRRHGAGDGRDCRPSSSTCFAVIAVVLAVIGVYGLIAYIVTQRTHEIGIRLALGATGGGCSRSCSARARRSSSRAWYLALAAAIVLRQLVSTFVFGVTAGDPLTYGVAALTFWASHWRPC